MLQNNARVDTSNGIKFYEQDILYDDYVYSGSCEIEVNIDYYNNGFGIVLINATSNTLSNENAAMLFRLNHKSVEIIYKENDKQKNIGTFSSTHAKTYTENLNVTLEKIDNIFTLTVGNQQVCKFVSEYDFDSYYIGYYSNEGNVINHINIASAIPYGWIINMKQTNGGYIDFHRDGFELKYCNGPASIEQIEIPLVRGTYFLKYEASDDSDIVPYIMEFDDNRVLDDEKNILRFDNSFIVNKTGYVSLKFKGTKGTIKNIAVTTSSTNDYIRTSYDFENVRFLESSNIEMKLGSIKSFSFVGLIKNVPGTTHYNPKEYSIVKIDDVSYGLYDLNMSNKVEYNFIYDDGGFSIYTQNDVLVFSIRVLNSLQLFNNVNGVISNFVITNIEDETINVTIENTVKKFVPALVKSPIVVLDENEEPLNLSSSYRYYYKHDTKYYWFTNTEREYFIPNHSIFLADLPLDTNGSIIVYGIKHDSKFILDNLLLVEDIGFDNIDACADIYDIITEDILRYVNKKTGEIRLESIDGYKYIIVDYVKANSYCLNYRYDLNSYEVDISIAPDKKVNMVYDNIVDTDDMNKKLKYINEARYVNTKISPTLNGYITIGGVSN